MGHAAQKSIEYLLGTRQIVPKSSAGFTGRPLNLEGRKKMEKKLIGECKGCRNKIYRPGSRFIRLTFFNKGHPKDGDNEFLCGACMEESPRKYLWNQWLNPKEEEE